MNISSVFVVDFCVGKGVAMVWQGWDTVTIYNPHNWKRVLFDPEMP
jgi:hypothetical protein